MKKGLKFVWLLCVLIGSVFLTCCTLSNGQKGPVNTGELITPRASSQTASTELSATQVPRTDAPSQKPEPSAEPSAQTLSPIDFFPLTVGSTWSYEGKGNEYASFTREVLYSGGDRAQVAEDNGGTVRAIVYQVSRDAIKILFTMGEAYDNENLLDVEPVQEVAILTAPLQAGTTWEEANGIREIVAVDAVVDTPAGKFSHCIQVKITYSDSILYEYFKQGVGMVKREYQSGESVVTSTLRKYQIME